MVLTNGYHQHNPWQLGEWGKGLITFDRQLIIWRTDGQSPHHSTVAGYLCGEDSADADGDTLFLQYTSPICITPSGVYTNANGVNWGRHGDGEECLFGNIHPDLSYEPDWIRWLDFKSEEESKIFREKTLRGSYGHGKNIVDILRA